MLNMRLKVVSTRRVPSTSLKRRNESRDYKRINLKEMSTDFHNSLFFNSDVLQTNP